MIYLVFSSYLAHKDLEELLKKTYSHTIKLEKLFQLHRFPLPPQGGKNKQIHSLWAWSLNSTQFLCFDFKYLPNGLYPHGWNHVCRKIGSRVATDLLVSEYEKDSWVWQTHSFRPYSKLSCVVINSMFITYVSLHFCLLNKLYFTISLTYPVPYIM